MTGKRISIGNRPVADPGAETWVRQGDGASQPVGATRENVHTARLTIDVTRTLRGRIKVAAFRQDVTVADMVRALLEREFPDNGGDA
jgi:hypothetical protein